MENLQLSINFQFLKNALRRPTPANNAWLREVDGLRLVALIPVVLQHLMERFAHHTTLPLPTPLTDDPFAFFISRGTVGVFLFFAISGFVLALPFARHHFAGSSKPSLHAYAWRRVTRLEPPYIIWMCLFAFVLLLKGRYAFAELCPHLLASLTYTHGLFFGGYSPINPVAWSLEVEIQFYLLAPFITALFFGISNRWARRTALVGAILGWISLQHHMGWLVLPYKLTILGQLPHFLVGLLAVEYFLTMRPAPVRQHVAWDIAAPLAYMALCYTWTAEFWKNCVFAAALWVLFMAALRGVYFRKILQNEWVAIAGGMCYTIYLTHLPLLEAITSITGHLHFTDHLFFNFWAQTALALPLVWLFGAIFFYTIEKPFMRHIPSMPIRIRPFKMRPLWWCLPILVAPIGVVAQTSTDTLRLRPLTALTESALLHASELKANATDVAKQRLVTEVQAKSWTDIFTVNGTAYYGNGIVNEIRSTDGIDYDYATGRLGTGINLSVGVRLSGGDLTTRKQKTQIQVLQLERLQYEREMLERHIRDEVANQYFLLENLLQTLRLAAENLETLRLARSVAEKYFKEGNLQISEYTTLVTQESKAHSELLKIQSEAKQRARLLEHRVQMGVFLVQGE